MSGSVWRVISRTSIYDLRKGLEKGKTSNKTKQFLQDECSDKDLLSQIWQHCRWEDIGKQIRLEQLHHLEQESVFVQENIVVLETPDLAVVFDADEHDVDAVFAVVAVEQCKDYRR